MIGLVLYLQLEIKDREINKLRIEKQAQIIRVLCEGNSIRSTVRITDSSINTVVKLVKDVGNACFAYQDQVMHNLTSKKIQVDENWSFVYSKDKNIPEDKDEISHITFLSSFISRVPKVNKRRAY